MAEKKAEMDALQKHIVELETQSSAPEDPLGASGRSLRAARRTVRTVSYYEFCKLNQACLDAEYMHGLHFAIMAHMHFC